MMDEKKSPPFPGGFYNYRQFHGSELSQFQIQT